MLLGRKTLAVIDFEMVSADVHKEGESILSVGVVASRLETVGGQDSYVVVRAVSENVVPLEPFTVPAFWHLHHTAFTAATAEPRISAREMLLHLAELRDELERENPDGVLFAAWPATIERSWLQKYERICRFETGIADQLVCLRQVFDANFSAADFQELPEHYNHPHIGVLDALGEAVVGLFMFATLELSHRPNLAAPVRYLRREDEQLIARLYQDYVEEGSQ